MSQAFTQSLTASSYHDSHLEVALDAHDLHREMSFYGVPVYSNMGVVGTIRVDIKLDKENRPYFMVTIIKITGLHSTLSRFFLQINCSLVTEVVSILPFH